MKRRQKKQFKRNKKEYTRLSDHIGFLPLVMVSPADSELIAGGSDERRRFYGCGYLAVRQRVSGCFDTVQ